MKKSKLAEIKARLDSMPDDVKAQRLAEIRARHYDRWMERMAEIGRPVSDPADIDFSEQQIHIEYLLCDPYNLRLIKSKDPAKKQQFLDKLNEEQRKCWYEPTKDGVCYDDMSKTTMRREVVRAVKLKVRGR